MLGLHRIDRSPDPTASYLAPLDPVRFTSVVVAATLRSAAAVACDADAARGGARRDEVA